MFSVKPNRENAEVCFHGDPKSNPHLITQLYQSCPTTKRETEAQR